MPDKLNDGVVDHIVHVSSGTEDGACEFCLEQFPRDTHGFAAIVNHYIAKHGYRLLHVGVESSYEREGEQVWNDTVAVLGRASRDA